MRTTLRLTLGIAVSLGCLYFATRGTDWSRVASVLENTRPGWVFAIVLAGMLSLYVRAQRWRVLLRPLGAVPLYPALSATAIGFAASSVLPFRIGEILRPALLGRRVGVGVSAALSTVVLERLFDMAFVIGCFLLLTLAHPMDPKLTQGARVLASLVAVGLVVLVLVQRNRARAERLADRLLGRFPGRVEQALRPLTTSFLNGLAGLTDARTVALVVVYSAYLWGVIALTYLFALLALDIEAPLLATSLAAVVIVAAFVFLPQAPGFVGTWQAACVLALHELFQVPKDLAVSYSLLTWIVQMVVNISLGGIFLAREDFSPGQLLRVAAED